MDMAPEQLSKDALTGKVEAATLTTTSREGSELDALLVNQFLDALAEVALSIASRKDKVPIVESDRLA